MNRFNAFNEWSLTWLTLFLQLGLCSLKEEEYPDYQYNVDYGKLGNLNEERARPTEYYRDYADEDYAVVREDPLFNDTLLCYDCSLAMSRSGGLIAGSKDCDDPFLRSPLFRVNTVQCDGGLCTKSVEISGENYTLWRECAQKCKDYGSRTSTKYTRCCNSLLCNVSQRRTISIVNYLTLLLLSLTSRVYRQ